MLSIFRYINIDYLCKVHITNEVKVMRILKKNIQIFVVYY